MATTKRSKKRTSSSVRTSPAPRKQTTSQKKTNSSHHQTKQSAVPFSFSTIHETQISKVVFKILPYIIMVIGICIALLFILQRVSASYGQFCGEYTSEFAYVDDCTCIGVKSVVPTQGGIDSYEIRCLGFKTSCHREYMVWPKTESIECADE